jgi:hypothetical protein
MEYFGWCSSVSWCCGQEQWCSCVCPVLVEWAASSWCSSSGRLLALLAAVVLPAQASHAVTKLLVSCLSAVCELASLSLVWSYSGRAVKLLCAHLICTPVVFKNRCYTWSINSMMQWQSNCQSLRVQTLTSNLFLCLFLICFAGYKLWRLDFKKFNWISLELGFFLFDYLL